MFDHWPDGRDGEGFRGGAMKAWQFEGEGKPISLNEIPEPRPGPGEVVIDVKAAGLCHSDIMYMEVGARTMPFLPMTQATRTWASSARSAKGSPSGRSATWSECAPRACVLRSGCS